MHNIIRLARLAVHFLIPAVLSVAYPSVSFAASLLLDASLREFVEDNVNPLLSGAAAPPAGADGKSMPAGARIRSAGLPHAGSAGTGTGDVSTALSAGVGLCSVVGPEAEVSIKATVERRQFSKFTELNATTAGLQGMVFKQFSDINAAQVTLSAFRSNYGLLALGGHGARIALDLRQSLSMKFWLNEGFGYERYDARSDGAAYDGRSIAVRAGYRFTPSVTPVAAYTCLLRRYGSGMQTTVHSAAVSAAWRIVKGLDLTGSLERLAYTSMPLETRGRDTISSLGIAVYY